ncbi:MAG: S8 family serine peptidase [Bdellovibrionales bacterium]|nr:S8 family serine peptidase [Bdellovibrionales bacterium]
MNKLITLFILLVLTNSHCTKAYAAIPDPQLDVTNNREIIKSDLQKEVIVAVIDTGIDIDHPYLKSNLWINSGESGLDESGNDKSTNGIDDDHNGYVDDIHGWDFTTQSNDLTDTIGHGTHISGIISGKSTPRLAISNLTKIKIMTLKYFDKDAGDTQSIKNTVLAIKYAVKMGASIINYSSSGAIRNKDEETAIKEASAKGIIFVTAAGNSGLDIDKYPYYPANYKAQNIIPVSSIDENFRLLASSNYGHKTILAPGKSIYSTLPGGRFGVMTGTSQATAFVSQSLASIIKNRTSKTLTDEILSSVKSDFTKSNNRLLMN